MLITDTAVHPLEYFDEYFSQVYTPREVSAQSFAADVAAGLWTYSGDVVLTDAESLVFRYYNEDGNLIKSQKITIVSDGKNAVAMTSPTTPPGSYTGQIGMYAGHFYQWNGAEWILQNIVTLDDISGFSPRYLGCFDNPPTNANIGDWYLLRANGVLFRYDGAVWVALLDYSDSRYSSYFMAAMGDLFLLAKNTGEQVFAERIVAASAMIQTLFSERVVLSNTGSISSENYDSGSRGFKINGAGAAEFNQGTFNNITVNQGTFGELKITYSGNILEYSARGSGNPKNLFSVLTPKKGVQMFGTLAFHVDGRFRGDEYITQNYYGLMYPTSFEFTTKKITFSGLIFFNGMLWSTSIKKSGYGNLNIYPNPNWLDELKINLIQGGQELYTINRISYDIEY